MPASPYGQRDPHHLARLLTAMVPDAIAKSITSDEYNDRIIEAARLSAQAADPALSLALRQAARLRGQAVLRAQPRQATRRQHADLIAKAAAAPPAQAEAIRRKADRLIEEEQPIAPSRAAAVRKAQKAKADAEDEPVPVFDANGNLIGICDAEDITPVSTGRQGSAQAPAQVAKASGRVVVYDQWRRPHLADRRSIRTTARALPRGAPGRQVVKTARRPAR